MKRGLWSILLTGILVFPFAVVQMARDTQHRLSQDRYLQETRKVQGWELDRLAAPLHPANAVTRLGKQFLDGLPAAFHLPPDQVASYLAALHHRVFPADFPLELMVYKRRTDFQPLLHAGSRLGLASFSAKLIRRADLLMHQPGKHNLNQREVMASLTRVFPQPVFAKSLKPDEPVRFLSRSPNGLSMLLIGHSPLSEDTKDHEFLVLLLARLSGLSPRFWPRFHLHTWTTPNVGLFFQDRRGGKGLGSRWFQHRPAVRALLDSHPRLAGEKFQIGMFGPWLIQSLPAPGRSRFRPFLVRRLPEALFPRGRGGSPLWFFLSTSGVGLGILFILQRIWMGRGLRLRVALGTVAIFLAGATIPLTGTIFLAQHLLSTTYETALHTLERRLHQHLENLDAGVLPFQGQFITQLRNFRFTDAQGRDLPVPTSPSEWLGFLPPLLKRAGIPGKALEAILVSSRSGNQINIYQDHISGTLQLVPRPDPLHKRIVESMRQHWALIAPERRRAGKLESPMNLQEWSMDLVDETITYLLGPETLINVMGFSSRRTSFSNFFESFSLLRTLVRRQGRPTHLITWSWSSRYLESPYIRQAIGQFGKTRPEFPTSVSLGREFETVRSAEIHAARSNFRALETLRLEAERSRRAFRQQDLSATDAPLLEALPGRHMKAILTAQASTADLAQQQARMSRHLVALGLGILAFVLLAGFAAGIFFLEPLGRVLAAIDQINRQEYAVALDADRADEFGQLGAAFNAMATGLREGTIIRRFVSDAVRQLVSQEGKVREACLTEATVLFSSFLGFDGFQTRHPPDEVFSLLQHHLSAAAEATAEHGGDIDKMVGDKVMIVFRHAGWSQPWSPAEAAVRVARSLRAKVAAAGCPLSLAIGINSGPVVAGAMGAAEVRLDLTVIGDPINLAARLATLAHTVSGSRIVLSGQTRDRLPPGFPCTRLPFKAVRGKTQAIEAWLLGES